MFLEISSTKKCRLHSEQNYFLRFLIVNTALKLDTVLKEGKWKSLFQRFSFDADINWSTILHSKVWEQEKFFFSEESFFLSLLRWSPRRKLRKLEGWTWHSVDKTNTNSKKTVFGRRKKLFLFKIKCAGHLPVERVRAPLVI